MTNNTAALPRTIVCDGVDVELRAMTAADEAAVLAFARALPPHDLLFLPRDISEPKVVAAWVQDSERGALTNVLAVTGATVVGCATIVRDELSWSRHVGELRVLIAPAMRGKGLGVKLTQTCFSLAVALGLEKIIAQMTVDQRGAIAVFQGMGFRPEALLIDHAKDRDGNKHDLVILGHDVARFQAQLEAYGVTEVESL